MVMMILIMHRFLDALSIGCMLVSLSLQAVLQHEDHAGSGGDKEDGEEDQDDDEDECMDSDIEEEEMSDWDKVRVGLWLLTSCRPMKHGYL